MILNNHGVFYKEYITAARFRRMSRKPGRLHSLHHRQQVVHK